MTTIEFSHQLDQMAAHLKPFAIKLTRDTDEAKDLIQDTMLKAYSNRDKFSDGTNLKAWLYTIMKNTFITNYQRMVKRKTFVDTTENLHFLNSSQHTIENLAYHNFGMKDLHEAIDNLDEVYKRPFVMYFRGFKYVEIAERLGIPLGTVKNRIHIARKELQYVLRKLDIN